MPDKTNESFHRPESLASAYNSSASQPSPAKLSQNAGYHSTAPLSVARSIDPVGYPKSMLEASNKGRAQFATAVSNDPKEEKAGRTETLETLRLHLAQLESQQTKCSAELQLNMKGPGATEVVKGVSGKNAEAIKITRERIRTMERDQRRRSFMRKRTQRYGPEAQQSSHSIQS
jgi:hypothetical protein